MNVLKGAPVLVAGGLGFIGSNLARRLVALGAEVTVIDAIIPGHGGNQFNLIDVRKKLHLEIGDVRDFDKFCKLITGKKYLFNLVGQVSHIDSMSDPVSDMEYNIHSQLAMLEACRKHNPHIRIVFTSTRQLYGKPEYLPVNELHPVHPTDVNGINKMAGEYYHTLYHTVHGLSTSCLRLTNTYGPGQLISHDRQGFIGWFIKQIVVGEEISIYGDGEQLRDLNHVDDVVEAILLAGLREEAIGHTFNLGSEDAITLKRLVEMLIRIRGTGSFRLVPFPPEKKRIDIGSFRADFSRIRTELGWTPKVPLERGLKETIDYYLTNRAHYLG